MKRSEWFSQMRKSSSQCSESRRYIVNFIHLKMLCEFGDFICSGSIPSMCDIPATPNSCHYKRNSQTDVYCFVSEAWHFLYQNYPCLKPRDTAVG